MFLAAFYHNPVPGFIFTAIVCIAFWVWAINVALKNYGPGARKQK